MGFSVEKQNLQQRETRGIFPVGFATAHLEVIREPGRPVSQAGALLAGQDELGERGSLWSLSVSPYAPVSPLCFVSFTFLLSRSHSSLRQNRKLTTCRRQQVYLGDGRWTNWTRPLEKVSLFPFAYMSIYPIYLFISPSGSPLSGEFEGLGISLWCVCRFVYMFKVGRFCLTRTMGHGDLGEDRRLPL